MKNNKDICPCDKYNLLVLTIWIILFLIFHPHSLEILILWFIGLLISGPLIHLFYCKLHK